VLSYYFLILAPKKQKNIVLYNKGGEIMGNIMKINMYAETKKRKNKKLNLKYVEQNILLYNDWLKKTNREDKIETYEEFLQAK